ncbi:MAG: hypothetical protein Kapaf2KO_16270 [Candidatus Kapaibacteriales bacterium]
MNKIVNNITLLLFLFFLGITEIFSFVPVREPLFYFGGRVSGGYNIAGTTLDNNKTNFINSFDGGSGLGYSFDGFIEFEVSKSSSYLVGIDLGYNSFNTEFNSENTLPFGVQGRTVESEVNSVINANLPLISILPYARKVFDNGLSIKLGLGAGIPLSSEYQLTESVSNPEVSQLLLNGAVANTQTNAIEGSVLFLARTDIGYFFSINDESFLEPGITLNYALGADIKGQSHSVLQPGLYLSFITFIDKDYDSDPIFRYNIDTIHREMPVMTFDASMQNDTIVLGKEVEKSTDMDITGADIIDVFRTDTLFHSVDYSNQSQPIELQTLKSNLKVFGETNGQLSEINSIYAKVQLSKDIYPLLPFVFFNENSSQIPERYNTNRDINTFDVSEVKPNPIEYHWNNLNFIGYNLSENPDTEITITGYVDPTTEEDRCDLAKMRAESIKKYLIDRYNISSNRIKIQSGQNCYPRNITRSQSEQGYAENRRVEITSNRPSKVFYVSRANYEEPIELTPENLLIDADVYVLKESMGNEPRKSEAFSTLTVRQNGYTIYQEENDLNPNIIRLPIDRNFLTNLNETEPIEVILESRHRYQKENDTIIVEVNKEYINTEASSLSLALFEVSSSKLLEKDKVALAEFISNAKAGSAVEVIGYSDILGDSESNKELSAVRAEEVAKAIRNINPSINISKVEGVGSDKLPPGLYGYDRPEERFISRTVQVKINTP